MPILRIVLTSIILLFYVLTSDARSSRLASGNWVRIAIADEGIHFLPAATLRSMGFSNPENVNVYGFGGRMISENLSDELPDDLPPVYTLHTEAGILFFGVGTVRWDKSDDWLLQKSHVSNPYSEKSYYFLSDIPINTEPHRLTTDNKISYDDSLPEITSFTQRLLHEQDILRPSQMGRRLLGEDFRGHPSRTFQFNLPGITGDALVRVGFGAKVTNGSAGLIMHANGTQLQATTSDRIPPASTSEIFLTPITSSKRITAPGEKLDLTINFSYSGNLVTAALDFIEIEYERELKLRNGQLIFETNATEESVAMVRGSSQSTIVWDVTDPLDIIEITPEKKGSELFFTITPGNRCFAVFNPEEINSVPLSEGSVINQDLHSMLPPDLLIISPEEFMTEAHELADLRSREDGMEVKVVTPKQIYNEFSSGTPDLSAFRRLLRHWYLTADCRLPSVLLLGRASNDPKGTARPATLITPEIPIWQSEEGFSASTSYSTDDFIAMLDTGPFNPASATIHTAVGRWPVKTAQQLRVAIEKLHRYTESNDLGPWRNNAVIVADDQDYGEHLMQAERMIDSMTQSDSGKDIDFTRIYLDTYNLEMTATGPNYRQATTDLLENMKTGTIFLSYIGHANAREWGHEKLLTASDISSLSNSRLPFLYAATCDFSAWDLDEESGAEVMWLNPNSGIIGALCPSRKVYIPMNADINNSFGQNIVSRDADNRQLSIGEAMVRAKNSTRGDNKLRYALMADPSLKLPIPSLKISFDSIGESSLNADSFPVINAKSVVRINGRILNAEGEHDQSFNGVIDIQLFDAERAVQSLGNGETGKVVTFNDRGPRLLTAKASVKHGIWKATISIPDALAHNFSNARLSAYAADSAGNEAHGSTSDFILYGYAPDADEDTEGPEIKSFYINGPLFSDGDVTGPSIRVFARLSDPSGINISESSVGQELSAILDNSRPILLSSRFEPTTDDFTSGELAFRLDDILPGRHSLTLSAYDNAGNLSSASLSFRVEAAWQPSITRVTALTAMGEKNTEFLVETDGISDDAVCNIEIFNMSGLHLTSLHADKVSKTLQTFSIPWNLRDRSGRIVSGGIYPFRVTVTDSSGQQYSKSSKIAVPGI